jgi:hypothetical protein
MKIIDNHPWINLKHRKVQHYGYQFDYNTNNVNKSLPTTDKDQVGDGILPAFCSLLLDRFKSLNLLDYYNSNDLTIHSLPIPEQLTVSK